jgi:hypothetical protein
MHDLQLVANLVNLGFMHVMMAFCKHMKCKLEVFEASNLISKEGLGAQTMGDRVRFPVGSP